MSDIEPKTRERGPTTLIALLALGLAAAGFGWLIVRAQALPVGVVPVVWDHEVCAHCKMHIGEPAFAAQLQLEDGRVANFDDPGCLMRQVARETMKVRAIYFRHVREDRWLPIAQVGFIQTSPTPMGFGLGAVDRTEAGAMSFEQARAHVEQGKEHTR